MTASVQMLRPLNPAVLSRLSAQRSCGHAPASMPAVRDASEAVRRHLDSEKPDAARRIEQRFRVPTCGDLWPGVYWIACVVVPDPAAPYQWVTPTDHEAWQIRSYIEYKLQFWSEPSKTRLLEAALPAYGGHTTITFCKHPDAPAKGMLASARGWGYMLRTWRDGGAWPHSYGVPGKDTDLPDHPLTLVELLDRRETNTDDRPNSKWEAWKAAHPSAFHA